MGRKQLYINISLEPFKLSRSGLEEFVKCPCCFYMHKKLGIAHPSSPGFSLNSAVDELLKREFDTYRADGKAHPLMIQNNIDAKPYSHEKLDEWRNTFKGIGFLHEPTNIYLYGGIDDIWVNPKGELIIVDYKATSKADTPNIDGEYQEAYKRQMDIYCHIFKNNDFKIFDTAYFVYCNGKKDLERFDKKLEFDIQLIPYIINDSWVEGALIRAKTCLESEHLPMANTGCDFCRYGLDFMNCVSGNEIRP